MKDSYKWIKRIGLSLNCTDFAGFIFERESRNDAEKIKYKLNNDDEIEYGWHLKSINGVPTREHGGSIFGFKSMAVYIPSEDICMLGFSNCDCNSPTQLVKDIAKLTLENAKTK